MNADGLTDSDFDPQCAVDERSQRQWLLFQAQPLTAPQLQQLSPAAFAYLGDAIYELFIRHSYLLPAKRIQTYHQHVVAQVRAEAQARNLQLLCPYLTEDEMNWVRRGRNAAGGRPKRVDPDVYQHATSLETLIGYLYLTNPTRLMELLNRLELPPLIDPASDSARS